MTHPLYEKAMTLARTYRNSESELLGTLVEMAERNLFILARYTDTHEYVLKALKLGESSARYFSKVAQRARVIPPFKQAILDGRLSVSIARRICPVITNENQAEWIEAALTLKQRALEEKVAASNPRARTKEGITPVAEGLLEMRVALTTEERDKLERAQNLLSQKTGKAASLEEVISEMTDFYLDKNDPVKKAERVSSRKPSQPDVPPPPPTTPKRQGRHPLKASVKHAINLATGFRCVYTDPDGNRCMSQRWLDYHHKIKVSHGGTDTEDNILLVCFYHHKIIHAQSPATS